jgi:hypothetical protein
MSTSPAINASTPTPELAALIAHVSELSKLAMRMTKYCVEVNGMVFLMCCPLPADNPCRLHPKGR